MTCSEKLSALRRERGVSQAQLAEVMGVSRQAVSRWEVGAVTPSMEKLRRLGEFYNIPVDLLMNDQQDLTEREEATTEGQPPEPAEKKRPRRVTRREVGAFFLGAILALAVLGIAVCWYQYSQIKPLSTLSQEYVGENRSEHGKFSLGW